MVQELINKYIWLVETILREGEGGISLEELTDRWEDRWDELYTRRTFNNHRIAIAEVFGVEIGCNRSTNRYFIEDGAGQEQSEAMKWLINSFSVNNMLNMSREKLKGRVSIEDMPSGHMWLTEIVSAMTENRKLVISYQKYTSSTPESLKVHPYAVKESSRRWYVVAFCEQRDGMRVYGLDRIQSVETTDESFKLPRGFKVDELFKDSYGPYLPDRPASRILLKATATEAKYLEDLPLHPSQRRVGREGDCVTFAIFATPNRDMIMQLCRFGPSVEVLAPKELREAVMEEHRKALEIYLK